MSPSVADWQPGIGPREWESDGGGTWRDLEGLEREILLLGTQVQQVGRGWIAQSGQKTSGWVQKTADGR